jgi:hypothetical protein
VHLRHLLAATAAGCQKSHYCTDNTMPNLTSIGLLLFGLLLFCLQLHGVGP